MPCMKVGGIAALEAAAELQMVIDELEAAAKPAAEPVPAEPVDGPGQLPGVCAPCRPWTPP